MEFEVITECTCFGTRTLCNEEIVEHEGSQRVVHYCKECNEDIEEIINYYK